MLHLVIMSLRLKTTHLCRHTSGERAGPLLAVKCDDQMLNIPSNAAMLQPYCWQQ